MRRILKSGTGPLPHRIAVAPEVRSSNVAPEVRSSNGAPEARSARDVGILEWLVGCPVPDVSHRHSAQAQVAKGPRLKEMLPVGADEDGFVQPRDDAYWCPLHRSQRYWTGAVCAFQASRAWRISP